MNEANNGAAARWDGFELDLEVGFVQRMLNDRLQRGTSPLRRIGIGGSGDRVKVALHLELRRFPARVTADLTELRLVKGFFGCRVESLTGPLGIPMPLTILAPLVDRHVERVNFDAQDGILIVDLRELLPRGIDVAVRDVRCVNGSLKLAVGPGAISRAFEGFEAEMVQPS
jgi:hypothetical protein